MAGGHQGRAPGAGLTGSSSGVGLGAGVRARMKVLYVTNYPTVSGAEHVWFG